MRLTPLLYFLLAFLFIVVCTALIQQFKLFAVTGAYTSFDPKGVVTGPGTFFALLIAMLLALIIFVALANRSSATALKKGLCGNVLTAKELRTRDEWLAVDVLGMPAAPPEGWKEMQGAFRGRKTRIERIEKFFRIYIESPLSPALEVWRRTENVPPPRADSKYQTKDAHFERACDWRSTLPDDAWKFLLRPGTTSLLKRLTLFATECPGPNVSIGAGWCASSLNDCVWPETLLFTLHSLELLAAVSAGQNSTKPLPPVRSQTFFSHLLNCLCLIGVVLVPVATAWTGASYYAAKWAGLGVGMAVFFAPLLLLALFVFTRPENPDDLNTAREQEFFAEKNALHNEFTTNPHLRQLVRRYYTQLGEPIFDE